jgi:hypothetical protein
LFRVQEIPGHDCGFAMLKRDDRLVQEAQDAAAHCEPLSDADVAVMSHKAGSG